VNPSARTLLEVWEQGVLSSPVYRALLLLAATCSETQGQLATLSVGERNRRLLVLRQKLFGATAEAVVECPQCSERLEFTLSLAELTGEASNDTERFSFDLESYSMKFRLPNSLDLLVLPREVAQARDFLLERCLVEIEHGDEKIIAKDLPENVIAALSEAMANADPHAVMELQLSCPACHHTWTTLFDIVSFLWRELDHWAKGMLLAVHRLASTYSWREEDILNMSMQRRQAYLEMLP
jgi:hypothetical protein